MQTFTMQSKPLSKTTAEAMTRFYRALFRACDKRDYAKIRELVSEYLTHDEWVWVKHPTEGIEDDMADLMHRAEQMIGM